MLENEQTLVAWAFAQFGTKLALISYGHARERVMFKSLYVVASMMFDGSSVTAEFDKNSGRLRVFSGLEVKAEWYPPNSWFALATVGGSRHWGTNPSEEDLRLLIQDFAAR